MFSHAQMSNVMLQLKKKAEFRQAGSGDPVFTYWVLGTPEELAKYKAIVEPIKTSNGASRYIPDLSDTYNGAPNPHKGNPVFLSFNGPIAEGTEVLFTDNGQGGNNAIANELDDKPENSSLEREWTRKRNLRETAEANALANLRADEVREQRKRRMNMRSALGMTSAMPTGQAHDNMSSAGGPAVTNVAVGNPALPTGNAVLQDKK